MVKMWSYILNESLAFKNCTYSKIQVLGQRVNEDHLACGSSPVQADGGVEVVVPEHGAAQQSDDQSYNQHCQQGDEPAQDGYTCGAGQISDIATTWKQCTIT